MYRFAEDIRKLHQLLLRPEHQQVEGPEGGRGCCRAVWVTRNTGIVDHAIEGTWNGENSNTTVGAGKAAVLDLLDQDVDVLILLKEICHGNRYARHETGGPASALRRAPRRQSGGGKHPLFCVVPEDELDVGIPEDPRLVVEASGPRIAELLTRDLANRLAELEEANVVDVLHGRDERTFQVFKKPAVG